MELPQPKIKVSTIWDHFDLLSENKVKCRICSTELSYLNKSTSSMLRHYRAKHQNEVQDTPRRNSASRKQMLDEALLNFILKDCQPLSIVESEGFRELIQVLEPSYVLPTRKTVKQMVAKKYEDLAEGNIARSQDLLQYWDNHKTISPNLFQLALQFLCTPASSVPCEQVFSTAGEVVKKA